MKKTCNNCRALSESAHCRLGFENEKLYFGGFGGLIYGARPLDDCPKPLTITELLAANKKE
jgi:hypothetical protein